MGLYFRKSISLGGGVRLNLSKKGIGLSGGVKGARVSTGPSGTYLNLSIPGTGIYYRKKLSGSNSSYRNSSNISASRYQYSRTIVNEYTGEQRTVRAATQWELDEMVRNEELRMETNELRARKNEQIRNQKEKADEMTRQAKEVQESFKKLISSTININDKLDWDKQYNNEVFPEFFFEELPPKEEKLNLFLKIIGKKNNYKSELSAYEERKKEALQEYFYAKDEFEAEKRAHNADVSFLREMFERDEESAIEKYASVVLANSKYPAELEMDYDVNYTGRDNTMYVSFLFPDMKNFPLSDKYTYNKVTDEIKEHMLSKEKARNFYESTLLAVGIRTIHELFEAIYTEAVKRVIFRGYLLTSEVTEEISDFSENVRKIFEITADKNKFQNLVLTDNNINEVLHSLAFTRVKEFANTSEFL